MFMEIRNYFFLTWKYTRKSVSPHGEIHADMCNTTCGNTPNTAHFYTGNLISDVAHNAINVNYDIILSIQLIEL